MVKANHDLKRKKKLKEKAAQERREAELYDLNYQARRAFQGKRFSICRQHCLRILQHEPDNDAILRLLLFIAMKEKDHAATIRIIEKLPWKEEADLALLLAEEHAFLDQPGRAIGIYEQILKSGTFRQTRFSRNFLQNRIEDLKSFMELGSVKPPGLRPSDRGLPGRSRLMPEAGAGRTALASQPSEPPVRPGAAPKPSEASQPSAPPHPAASSGAQSGRPAEGLPIRMEIEFDPPELEAPFPSGEEALRWIRLRRGLGEIDLLREYDDLLCLGSIHGIQRYWFQVETAKRVLRQFHGRVLLADEVGLGKTIEAGMVIKEYILRGLARRVLILTPPNLVEQWQEEMAGKFDLEFVEPGDRRTDPGFWRTEPLIIASINSAKSERISPHVIAAEHDLVVVDEAHHLRNRSTRNWQLVNSLHRRFLILISATPVQNNLVELFNLLTLLRPGLLKTETEFKRKYISRTNPRLPKNRDELRELMTEVMIRNTRALVDVRLPPRHATTVAVDPDPEEADVYSKLTDLLRTNPGGAISRLDAARLLPLAGSAPFALKEPLDALKDRIGPSLNPVLEALARVHGSSKIRKTVELIQARPGKKILFAHSRQSLEHLSRAFEEAGISHALFHGGLPQAGKDMAIGRFRDAVDLLLSSESGGEGRNLQFCAAMVNFDLPWNPMRIEQRIGRIHRIGQEKEVFILNLCTRGTVEEKLLRLLHEKINMFELVVGEIDGILGNLADDREFADVILELWLHPGGSEEAEKGFDALGERMVQARGEYAETLRFERELFSEDFQV